MADRSPPELGAPPPVDLISLALVIYAFFGIGVDLCPHDQRYRVLPRLPARSPFSPGSTRSITFSGHSPTISGQFFFAGLSVMGLESYNLWTRNSAAIASSRSIWQILRAGRPPLHNADRHRRRGGGRRGLSWWVPWRPDRRKATVSP